MFVAADFRRQSGSCGLEYSFFSLYRNTHSTKPLSVSGAHLVGARKIKVPSNGGY